LDLKNRVMTSASDSTTLSRRIGWGLRGALITADVLLSTACHSLFLLLLKPLMCRLLGREDLYWRIEGFLFERIFGHVATWTHTAGYRLCLHGDAIPSQAYSSRTLVICNHVSTADVPTLFYLWVNSHPCPIPNLWWVMDMLFKWTPFGWVSQVHRDHFILQGKETRQGTLAEFSRSVARTYLQLPRNWCVIFPEGGFHYKRIAASNRFAEKHGLPPMDHVTYPRVGAIYAFAEALRTASPADGAGLDYIIDMTIGYQDNKPHGLDDIVLGWSKSSTVHVNQRVFNVSKDAVPLESSDELLTWLYSRWQEKNSQLDEFYRTGEFPTTRHCPVEFHWPNIILGYLVSAGYIYLMYRLVCFVFVVFGLLF
ncbi:hypothetical protein BOX15_Mlig029378g1, partial [Macrostomum lignano]